MFSARSSLRLGTWLALSVLAAAPLQAQLSVKTAPYSFRATLDAVVPTYTLPAERLDLAYQRYRQAQGDFVAGPAQHGLEVAVDLGLDNAGRWEPLPGGGRLWRLRIASEGAGSINLVYDDFWMPPGASLFLYNEDRSVVLGAFTERHNKTYGGFATDILPGDATILEYYEPVNVAEPGRLHVSSAVHGFLSGEAQHQLAAGPYTPLALSCSINVACSEGNGWSKEIGATVKIVNGGGSCTGVLVNNAEEDEAPYVLTANHCGFATVGQNVNWVFAFNYQSDTCADPAETPSSAGTITGGLVKAASNSGDFTLVELTEGVPSEFGAYFAGWSLTNAAPTSGTVIGHPKGDIKKITLEDHAVSHSGSYWEATFDHGSIETSSSGSPLFDENNRLRGILQASLFLDENACSGPGGDDNQPRILFPKLNVIWNMGNAGERLSDFLDPQSTGTTSVPPLQATGQSLPVELVSFEAVLDGQAALLRWETASETNNAGFEIQRISNNDGATPQWEMMGYVEGHGTTIEPQTYTYRVDFLEAGQHRFRLKQIDFDGTFEYSPEVEVAVGVPGAYHLSPAYPNPFNPETSFSLSVARGQQVQVAVYNLLGQQVALLFDSFLEAESTRAFTFEAEGQPSGLYLIRVQGERFTDSHTVTLLK